jgi:predicted deacylase
VEVSEAVNDSPIVCTVDYDGPGKQFGWLQVPRSTNESATSHLFVPVICIVNGTGPTVLVIGGVHGDEPEGQVAALTLARTVTPEQVRGRLIILPCMSPEASRAYTRLWPSGANLNRSFPGAPNASLDQQLADYLTRVLFPRTDFVMDIHSGGRTLRCLVWSEMHLVDDPVQRAKTIDAMLAWNTDYHYVYIDVAGSGLLVSEAERQGKITLGTELGGGGHATAATHQVAQAGLWNYLCHTGVLAGAPVTRAGRGLAEATIIKALTLDDFVFAPESGLFEPTVELGAAVECGQPVGRLHFIERPDRSPVEIEAGSAGIVCQLRAIASTRQGDCLVVTAQPCRREDLL